MIYRKLKEKEFNGLALAEKGLFLKDTTTAPAHLGLAYTELKEDSL